MEDRTDHEPRLLFAKELCTRRQQFLLVALRHDRGYRVQPDAPTERGSIPLGSESLPHGPGPPAERKDMG